MAFEGNQEIQALLNADAEAEKIIRAAREGKTKRVKEARIESAKIIDEFRKEQESEFELYKEENKGASGASIGEMEGSTEGEIAGIMKSVSTHKGEVIDLIVKAVSTVDVDLSQQ